MGLTFHYQSDLLVLLHGLDAVRKREWFSSQNGFVTYTSLPTDRDVQGAVTFAKASGLTEITPRGTEPVRMKDAAPYRDLLRTKDIEQLSQQAAQTMCQAQSNPLSTMGSQSRKRQFNVHLPSTKHVHLISLTGHRIIPKGIRYRFYVHQKLERI